MRSLKALATAAGCAAVVAALPATSSAAPPHQARTAAVPAVLDPVMQWNRFVLDLQATPGAQPTNVHPTYDLAIVHTAIYDAAVSIHHAAPPYLVRDVPARGSASTIAAVNAAAHDTLVRLYPALRAPIDQRYLTMQRRVPNGARRIRGTRVGRVIAARILASRAADGSTATPPAFTSTGAPGDYQATPPALAPPVFTHWPAVRPFVLHRANELRPPAPPALTSPQYAAALEETRALGSQTGSTRTPEQTEIGLFWNAPIWATWNRIAQTVSLTHHSDLFQSARTFAALNLAFADSTIAFYDAKYAYRLWRPVTAIRMADTDGNPGTVADPAWTPLSPTAPDPSYPGAHATISAAGAHVLAAFFGDRGSLVVTSPTLPGAVRPFTTLSAAAQEASVSRIYNGNHTRLDEAAGQTLGRDVAARVLQGRDTGNVL
jgi:membrane-associated phospholipid phosphatase